MFWVLDVEHEVAGNCKGLRARTEYIERVTGSKATEWAVSKSRFGQNGKLLPRREMCYCSSNEGIYGAFVTAHVNRVVDMAREGMFCLNNLVVANTCAVCEANKRRILSLMRNHNPHAHLLFAKQDKRELGKNGELLFAEISEVGGFGFATTLSERKLYFKSTQLPILMTPTKRLITALYESFDEVRL